MQKNTSQKLLLTLGLAASLALVGCASRPALQVTNMQQPSVGEPSEDVSFWRDTVTYPFPVHYGKAKDARGIEWEIAYMDEYAGKPEDKAKAEVLVLVHGKGADSGYWSALMKDALSAGLRVIAVDLPFYGKSIPGNLDKPFGRTLEDTRVAIHDLLVNQLGVEKANYLGHSLGAQWVLGYALNYPQAVDKIILEGVGALETYPRSLKLPNGELPWMDPSYANDYEKWEQIWEPVFGRLAAERNKTPEELELFHFWKKKDPQTGEIVDASVGFYLNKTPDALYQNEVRIKMIQGPKAEFEAWNVAYNRDVYTQGIELLKDDPNSIPARIDQIKAPMFIAYGEKEPFIPVTVVTGNADLRLDLVKPTYDRIVAAGGPAPVVKFYEGAGHFPHTDLPEIFNADVIDFVYDGRVKGAENPKDYKKPAIQLPPDIQEFADGLLKALNSGDAKKIMPFYSEDFKADGRDYKATKETYEQFGMMTAGTWKLEITDIKIDGDIAELDGTLSNQFVTGSLKGHKLRKKNGQWKMIGKQ